MIDISLYIHIPFCKSKCSYCDFLSSKCDDKEIDDYVDLLIKEINLYRNNSYTVKTLFIGGGTPSILSKKQLNKLVTTLKEVFNFNLTEFTIECNPESIEEEKLIFYKSLGINRISIGIQSLNDKSLKEINRLHTSIQALNKVELARKHFENVSCDLIYGLPYEEDNDLVNNVDKLTNLGIKHLSLYLLTLEKNTKLCKDIKENKLKLADDDIIFERFEKAIEKLESKNFNRYEISNFALKGYESKHNLAYWKTSQYLGLGLGAYGTIDNIRYSNTRNILDYKNKIELDEKPIYFKEKITQEIKEKEYIMLSLRLSDGIIFEDYKQYFDKNFNEVFNENIEKAKEFLEISDKNIRIKEKYFNISNSVILMFI